MCRRLIIALHQVRTWTHSFAEFVPCAAMPAFQGYNRAQRRSRGNVDGCTSEGSTCAGGLMAPRTSVGPTRLALKLPSPNLGKRGGAVDLPHLPSVHDESKGEPDFGPSHCRSVHVHCHAENAGNCVYTVRRLQKQDSGVPHMVVAWTGDARVTLDRCCSSQYGQPTIGSPSIRSALFCFASLPTPAAVAVCSLR